GEALALLAAQLGYMVDATTVEGAIERFGRHSPSENGAADETEVIIVARNGIGRPVGWTSVSVVSHFYTPTVAEISGFIVEESLRGRGIGTAMMDEVLRWARAAGCPGLRLRANAVRVDAHRFYEREGYHVTGVRFRKDLRGVDPETHSAA
ncbi:MAG: GNAT family N-acetyltransferase, partial [Desulfobacterales bacterium]|nr:GNAT family N-acetyltransferase [Desulfobacterales bacterium]